MIVDTSAVIAIAFDEPECDAFVAKLRAEAPSTISAANLLESGIVVDRADRPRASARLDAMIQSLEIEAVPVTVEQARIARRAYQQYGKGMGHPAQLNFGDCFAYALAIESGEPLLFKGDDFRHTDVRIASVG